MKKESTFYVGNLNVKLSAEVYEGETLDTEVNIGGENLCVIAGSTIEDFKQELQALVDKFSI
jgi:hypothetical protein